jgi:hypothetical protein
MKRNELEHLLRAAEAIAQSREIVVLGSQAILGMYPQAPGALLDSMEVDLYPADDPAKADLIDGSIGELSPFHDRFGYYARGVGPATAQLLRNWQSRLVPIANENTAGITGKCLHPVDIVVSKIIAGRPKDMNFAGAAIRHKLVDRESVILVCDELDPGKAALVKSRMQQIAA